MEEKHTWDKVNQWGEELGLLRAVIQKTELVETRKWGGEVFTINNKNVLGIGGFKNFFTIWFFNGVFLKDTANVLVSANEGVTKGLRQWRFLNASEIDEKLIMHYILEAISNEKKGLSIKPEKKETKSCDILQNELKIDSQFNSAFQRLTPYKQKEFWEYMATAKQEKTKISRLEKVKELITAGIGLNDKYKS